MHDYIDSKSPSLLEICPTLLEIDPISTLSLEIFTNLLFYTKKQFKIPLFLNESQHTCLTPKLRYVPLLISSDPFIIIMTAYILGWFRHGNLLVIKLSSTKYLALRTGALLRWQLAEIWSILGSMWGVLQEIQWDKQIVVPIFYQTLPNPCKKC